MSQTLRPLSATPSLSPVLAAGMPANVRIVEVSPRDGLQNETVRVPTEVKLALVQYLLEAGLTHIEVAAFVSPKWVPQMADSADLLQRLGKRAGVSFAALVPNSQGYALAAAAGCEEIAVFAAASESFSQQNINCSIADSLARFTPVIAAARNDGVRVRGYVSCVLGCPFEGDIAPAAVAAVAKQLYEMGCYEISLGDTIGAGTPGKTRALIDACARYVPLFALAGHFHDTYGMAVANVDAALQAGIATFDASVAGVGGCPYSPGATGNVATEDIVYLCNAQGIRTGVDLDKLVDAGVYIATALGRDTGSRVARALLAKRKRLARPT